LGPVKSNFEIVFSEPVHPARINIPENKAIMVAFFIVKILMIKII